MRGRAAHGRGECGVAEYGRDVRSVGRDGRTPRRDRADSLGLVVLVDDPRRVRLARLLDGRQGLAARLIRRAAERVVRDHAVDDRRECGHVLDRRGQHPGRRLRDGLLDKVSHYLSWW